MNEELKAQLIPILENTKDGLAAAVDFLCEQSPLLVDEILRWEGIKSGMVFFIYATVMIIGMIFSKKIRLLAKIRSRSKNEECIRLCGEHKHDECMWCPILGVIAHIIIFVILPIVVLCNLTWVKVLVAPRLFLIEYVRDWL